MATNNGLMWGYKSELKLYAIKKRESQLDSDIQFSRYRPRRSSQDPLNFVCVIPRLLSGLLENSFQANSQKHSDQQASYRQSIFVEAIKK
jgi:enhancing lycopene biosynthesis protein 2